MINKVILLGYVGSEPEIRSFESGSRMARIRMATSEKIRVRATNEVRQHTEWHTVIFWGEAVNFIDQYIDKGSQIYVEGSLRYREWIDKEGGKQIVAEIAGKEIKVVNQPKSADSSAAAKAKESPKINPPKDDLDNLPF
ncbi:MAG: single-stranded DNA-binding protein [Rikenellaceae bacterium]